MDYETVMGCVEDFNRLTRFLFRGGVRQVRCGSRYTVYTREDVLPILEELKDMLDRSFRRLDG